jgi:hypothetical protein
MKKALKRFFYFRFQGFFSNFQNYNKTNKAAFLLLVQFHRGSWAIVEPVFDGIRIN